MKPRRLQRLTILSMRWTLVGALISVTDYTDQKSCRGVCAKRLPLVRRLTSRRVGTTTTCSALRFDLNLGLDRVRDEALLVRSMVHLLDLLRGRMFFTGESQPRL